MAGSQRHRKADALPSGDLIWQQLEAALGPAAEARPEGSVTTAEFSARRGVSRTTAEKQLNALVKRGVMSRVAFVNDQRRHEYAYTMIQES